MQSSEIDEDGEDDGHHTEGKENVLQVVATHRTVHHVVYLHPVLIVHGAQWKESGSEYEGAQCPLYRLVVERGHRLKVRILLGHFEAIVQNGGHPSRLEALVE